MSGIDTRDRLKENSFSYKVTKANKTIIYFKNRRIKTLSEKKTKKFNSKINELDDFGIQLTLAKLTGNFKRGNEK